MKRRAFLKMTGIAVAGAAMPLAIVSVGRYEPPEEWVNLQEETLKRLAAAMGKHQDEWILGVLTNAY